MKVFSPYNISFITFKIISFYFTSSLKSERCSLQNSFTMQLLPASLLLLAFLPAISLGIPNVTSTDLPVEVIHEFPKGTWIENLVVRPSGSVLAIDFSAPNIFEVSISANSTPTLIHTFENATSVSGIAESSSPDVYFVMTGSFTFANFSAVPGSYAIHRLAFDECSDAPIVTQLATLPTLSMPNGIIVIPQTPYVLIADSIAGLIYHFDTETLALTTFLDDSLLKPSGTSLQAGVNGIKFSRDHFYFSNTNQELIARIRVSGRDATLQGKPEIVASQTVVDDFMVDERNGDIFIAEGGINELAFVSAKGNSTVPETLVGASSLALADPTAAVWARGEEGKKLIISTTGGVLGYLSGNHTVGGTISAVNVGKKH